VAIPVGRTVAARRASPRIGADERGVYSDAMTEIDSDRFRSKAAECRQLSETAINPLDKEAWLQLAEDWTKLAEDAQEMSGWQHVEP
jgi:hypothetical protein